MGFLRRLFAGKKQPPPASAAGSRPKPGKDKKTRSFLKHTTRDNNDNSNKHNHSDPSTSSFDANQHAVAVAAATAAVAEAALAAAHAAAEVVRLTSGSGPGASSRAVAAAQEHRRLVEETAAVKIQSAFRGYLARRALRALKALVKLQALVRGHIVRKQTADMLRRMQTLVRLQARARASRVHLSNNMYSFKSSPSHYPVHEDYQHSLRAYGTKFDGSSILKRCSSNANCRNSDLERARFGSNRLDNWMEESAWNQTGNVHPDDEKSDKILEVDTWKPQTAHHYFPSDYNYENFTAHESPSKHSSKALSPSLSSREVLHLDALKFHKGKEVASRTVENSPQAFSTSSRIETGARRGPFTPTKSECSGFFSSCSSHPNYMANTESSRAKVRSLSAPRQRLEFERYGSTRSVQGHWDTGSNSDRDFDLRSNKAYPTSSKLNKIGSNNSR